MALIEIAWIFPAFESSIYGWDFPWQTVSHQIIIDPIRITVEWWLQETPVG